MPCRRIDPLKFPPSLSTVLVPYLKWVPMIRLHQTNQISSEYSVLASTSPTISTHPKALCDSHTLHALSIAWFRFWSSLADFNSVGKTFDAFSLVCQMISSLAKRGPFGLSHIRYTPQPHGNLF